MRPKWHSQYLKNETRVSRWWGMQDFNLPASQPPPFTGASVTEKKVNMISPPWHISAITPLLMRAEHLPERWRSNCWIIKKWVNLANMVSPTHTHTHTHTHTPHRRWESYENKIMAVCETRCVVMKIDSWRWRKVTVCEREQVKVIWAEVIIE